MSHRSRSAFPWSSATRDMRNDRQPTPAGFLGARSRIEVAVRFGRTSLVTSTGAFDRAGIMSKQMVRHDARDVNKRILSRSNAAKMESGWSETRKRLFGKALDRSLSE